VKNHENFDVEAAEVSVWENFGVEEVEVSVWEFFYVVGNLLKKCIVNKPGGGKRIRTPNGRYIPLIRKNTLGHRGRRPVFWAYST
jgi:hypothetical protein